MSWLIRLVNMALIVCLVIGAHCLVIGPKVFGNWSPEIINILLIFKNKKLSIRNVVLHTGQGSNVV